MTTIDKAKYELCLRLGDNALIMGHRLAEWCGHGPYLEEDIALTNISLDYIGLAGNLLGYAAQLQNNGKNEDHLAYLRNEFEYKNALITEQPNGDFAQTMVRQFLVDTFSYYFYKELCNSADDMLKGIAEKAVKEEEYHLRHSTEWMYRLGDGTSESNERAQNALNDLWMFTGDIFDMPQGYHELESAKVAPEISKVKQSWETKVKEVMQTACLKIPENAYMQKGSLTGTHTEHLGYILTEMQYVQRAFPNSEW